jgi:hypothetical protein
MQITDRSRQVLVNASRTSVDYLAHIIDIAQKVNVRRIGLIP